MEDSEPFYATEEFCQKIGKAFWVVPAKDYKVKGILPCLAGNYWKNQLEPIISIVKSLVYFGDGGKDLLEESKALKEFLTGPNPANTNLFPNDIEGYGERFKLFLCFFVTALMSPQNADTGNREKLEGSLEMYKMAGVLDHINNYCSVIGRLNLCESLDLFELNSGTNVPEIFIQQKKTGFRIQRMDAMYYFMTELLGTNDDFATEFLRNDDFRRNLLTNGCMINISSLAQASQLGSGLELFPFSDSVPQEEEGKGSQGSQGIIGNILASIDDSIAMNGNYIFFWPGIGMQIPDNAKINLSLDRLFPTLVIREKGATGVAGDTTLGKTLFIEENPWHVNLIFNDPSMFKFNNLYRLDEVKTPIAGNASDKEKQVISLALSSSRMNSPTLPELNPSNGLYVNFSKGNYANIATTYLSAKDNINQMPFSEFQITIEKSWEDCEISIEVPYPIPKADLLLRVNFIDDLDAGIVLTCS